MLKSLGIITLTAFPQILQENAKRKEKFTGYRLMTSVSIPVFDKKNHTVSERRATTYLELISASAKWISWI